MSSFTSNNYETSSSFKETPIKSENNDSLASSLVSKNGGNQTLERKRRDNINDKIQELGTLIPRNIFESNKDKSSGTKDGKPNKGQILSKSIEYIEFLQDKIDENNKKEIELLIILKKLEELKKIPDSSKPSKTLFQHTSAEIALQNIGVGPLAEGNDKSSKVNSPNNVPPSSSSSSRKRSSVASMGSPLNPGNNNNALNSNTPSPFGQSQLSPTELQVPVNNNNINNNNGNSLNTNFDDMNFIPKFEDTNSNFDFSL